MSEYSAHRPIANGVSRLSKTHKEYEKNEAKERRKALLHLILGYLRDCNLHETADSLTIEAQLTNQFEICDNIDLDIMLQDYQSYYYTKFNKTPKIIRKVDRECSTADVRLTPPKRKTKITNSSHVQGAGTTLPQSKLSKDNQSNVSQCREVKDDDFHIDVTYLGTRRSSGDPGAERHETSEWKDRSEEIPKPTLCDHPGYSPEWRELADLITKEIVPKKVGCAGLGWGDCIGVREGVELLKEAVVYPLIYPDLFTGLLTPWKGILLFGPPGTGKTLLAKALAVETTSTFINLTISTFVSKWRGDSEKLLKVLFDVARLYAPTTIFIDELDAIASKFEDHQHDASRRFKSELLVQLDGLLSGDERIFVLATTNSPWNLNSAILRRFEKRILLNVPTPEARADLFRHYFNCQNNAFTDDDFRWMAANTNYFSGADIKLVCKEVLMTILRAKLIHIDSKRSGKVHKELRTPSLEDVKEAIQKRNPTSHAEIIERYAEWARTYGSL